VRALTERVVEAIAGWAQDAGHAVDAAQHATLRDELAALVMTQRATFATPVRLNAGLAEHPLTSACFRSTAATLGPAGLQPLITRARSGIRRERLRLAAWVPLAGLAVVP
jgi:hypothetical protein